MNKFKKVMLGALSVLTLGLFVVTGTKVTAATSAPSDGTYTVYAKDYYGGSHTPSGNYKAGDKDTNDMTLEQKGFITLSSGTNYYEGINVDTITIDSNCYTKTATSYGMRMGGGRTMTFTLNANQTATVTAIVYSSSSGKKIRRTDSKGSTLFNADTTAVVYSTGAISVTASDNVLFWEGSMSLVEMTVVVSTSSKTNEELAAEAIAAIGTVEYTSASKSLIDAAKVKIDACSDSSAISNYSVYTAAVSSFNAAKSAAITAFTTAVGNIGTVDVESGSKITTAEAAYAVLFGDALTDSNVTGAKSTLDTAKATYDDLMASFYSQSVNLKDVTAASAGSFNEKRLNNSVFVAIDGGASKMAIDSSSATFGTTTYTQRIFTGGGSVCTSDAQQKVIKFTALNSGKLKLAALSTKSGDARTISIYNSEFTKLNKDVSVNSNKKAADGTDIDTNEYTYIDIESAGTYYIYTGGSIAFYYLEYISNATIYWQQGTGESTDFVRVIGVVGNVEFDNEGAISNIDKITFTYTKSGTTTLITKTVANAYTQINDGNSAYEIGYISFASHDSKLYAVYQFDGYNAFHAAGKSMDISINVYYSGSDTPVTATKTIS